MSWAGMRDRSLHFIRAHHCAVVVLYLVLLEVLTFGHIWGKVGFYLDDWNMLSQLHFGPQDLLPMAQTYFFGDPKIIVRPVEVPHFIAMFLAFRLKPIGYHLVNAAFEVAIAVIVYLIATRLTRSKLFSFVVASIFLLYPIHDSTHYWVVASSATLSLFLYVCSVWCHMRSGDGGGNRGKWLCLAYIAFAISIFNYECFLPLFPFNLFCAAYMASLNGHQKPEVKRLTLESVGYFVSIAAVVVYGRWLVPMLGTAWVHSAHIDPVNIVTTVVRGVQVSITPEPFAFLANQIAMDKAWSTPESLVVFALVAILTAVVVAAFGSERMSVKQLAGAAIGGVLFVVLSFSIFGLNPEYQPTLTTFVNRINYGAAIGASFLFGAIIVAIAQMRAPKLTITLALASFIAFSMLGTWSMSRPWILATVMHKQVQTALKQNATAIKHGDSVLLLNSPRYIMWSPVFDGIWDFQNVLRLTLNDDSVSGTVVSDRLQVGREQITDVSHGYICGNYPYKQMHALVATRGELLPITSSEDFIHAVSTHGMGFDLDRTLPAVWRTQLATRRNELVQ